MAPRAVRSDMLGEPRCSAGSISTTIRSPDLCTRTSTSRPDSREVADMPGNRTVNRSTSGPASALSLIRSPTACPRTSLTGLPTAAPGCTSIVSARFEEATTTSRLESRPSSNPCGWMAPGTWIGSRSQLVRSTGSYAGVWADGGTPVSPLKGTDMPPPRLVGCVPDSCPHPRC